MTAKRYTRQVVVRVDQDLFAALEADAERYGRTVAQSIRFHLRNTLIDAPSHDKAWADEHGQDTAQ